MIRLPLPLRTPLLPRRRCLPLLLARSSSGSPSPTNIPADHFIKTGDRGTSDPTQINLRSNEYSQSGGDDMVAAQTEASFSRDTDAAETKAKAGKGNVVNPLELSPATPELSACQKETVSFFFRSGDGEGEGGVDLIGMVWLTGALW